MANQVHTVSAAEVAARFASATLDEFATLRERYATDPRKQVQRALARAERRFAREQAEGTRVERMYEEMYELGGDGLIVGVDEVGRGSVGQSRSPSALLPYRAIPSCGA